MTARTENSYDFVRFLAAAAVLYSHQHALSGLPEPPVPLLGEDFGKLGVEVFFALSGYLICRSLQRSVDWPSFIAARAARILPNLLLALAITSIATLFLFGNYSNAWEHARYVAVNATMFVAGVEYRIPGVFEAAHNPAVNGPLWSLPIELWMYALLYLAVLFGGRRVAPWLLILAIAFSLVWGLTPVVGTVSLRIADLESGQLARLGSYFLSGALLAYTGFWFHQRAVAIGLAAFILLAILRAGVAVPTLAHALALATAFIGIGSSRTMSWFSRGGDPSYGMYIFAWPVQQFSLMLTHGFWSALLLSLAATIALAYATWHILEAPAIAERPRLAGWLRNLTTARL